jgi:hypothetical protein
MAVKIAKAARASIDERCCIAVEFVTQGMAANVA